MFRSTICLLLLSLATVFIGIGTIDYTGHKVFRLRPSTEKQIYDLRDLENEHHELNFWRGVSKDFPVDILVPPSLQNFFQNFTTVRNITSQLLIGNVQDKIIDKKDRMYITPENFNWNEYRTLDEINEWLKYIVRRYQPFVKLVEAGRSYENRTIYGVHISFGKQKKPTIFIDGGLHSNEWISPATVTFIINQILTNKDPKMRAVIESREWIILPCLNPDGYVYTHTVDRLWRKNRRPTGMCTGIDLNRNFPYQWMDGGADIDSCFPHYAGSNPLSEPESQSFTKYFKKLKKVELYVSFHSYLQVYLIPFANQGMEVPKNNDQQHRVANIATRAAYGVHNARYLVGNSAATIYVGSGTSTDWVQSENKKMFVYTLELRDAGSYGFLLPPEQIIPCGEENFAAVVSLVEEISQLKK